MVPSMFYKLGLGFAGQTLFREKFYLRTILLTPEKLLSQNLAAWFSQYGSVTRSKKTVRLSTDQALRAEVELLQVVLQKNFNLFFTIQKAHLGKNKIQNYRLFLNRKQVPLLIDIIKPYLEPLTYSKFEFFLDL
jgi:hypothetical protein